MSGELGPEAAISDREPARDEVQDRAPPRLSMEDFAQAGAATQSDDFDASSVQQVPRDLALGPADTTGGTETGVTDDRQEQSDVEDGPILRVVGAADLVQAAAPSRSWLVDDLIPGDATTMLASDGGGGKTTLALQLAVATVFGTDFLGMKVTPGNVLYYTAEDEGGELGFRLRPILDGRDLEGAPYEFAVYSALRPEAAEPVDPTLAKPSSKSKEVLEFTDRYRQLQRFVKKHAVKLVVIDALAEVYAGNENDRHAVAQFIRQLQHLALKHSCAVLVLAHPSVQGMASGRGYSGNTHWNAGVKSRLSLTRKNARGSDDGRRTLSLEKSNRSLSGVQIELEWKDGAFEKLGANAAEDAAKAAEAEQMFLTILKRLAAKGKNVSSKVSKSYAPKLFVKEPDGKVFTKKALEAAMNSLLADGRIEQVTVGSESRRRGLLRLGPRQTGFQPGSNAAPGIPTPSNETSGGFQPPEDET